jgi:hypothetical protein
MPRLRYLLPFALLAACAEDGALLPGAPTSGDPAGPGLASYYVADTVDGNPVCSQLGYDFGIKIDRGGSTNVNGTWQVGTLGSVTVTGNGTVFDWTSTFGIDAVSAKGGRDGAIVYRYEPESTGDTGLNPPINPSGSPAQISHLDFCFDVELVVEKTATTSFTRTWDWTIDKSATADALLLTSGQTAPAVTYTVGVNSTSQDSDWGASGTISVTNPAWFATEITSVTDIVSGDIAATVSCGDLPAALAAGATLTCTYTVALPDASSRLNTATATTNASITGTANSESDGTKLYGTGGVHDASGTADVIFGEPTTLIDESVTVTDSRQGTLGTATGSGIWSYALTFGPYTACGEYDEPNTASFLTNDRGLSGSDSWNVHISVTGCGGGGEGCTLTQGYWKTHSAFGPAPYDNAWTNLGSLEQNTAFYASGMTWYQVFWTAPAGNAYFVLAHQYMAAQLNVLNGASTTPAVDAALAQANSLFSGMTGTMVARNQRSTFTALAATLDQYNNGLIGPGHCSE